MSASQGSGKAGIQCLHEYPIFTFYFNWMTKEPSEQGYTWYQWTAVQKKKNLDRKFWKLGRVAYLPMETDVDEDNLKSLNAPGFRGVAQGMLKYRDPHSSWSAPVSTLEIERVHFYVIIKLPPISFTLQNARTFIWPYYWVLKSRWRKCLGGYE